MNHIAQAAVDSELKPMEPQKQCTRCLQLKPITDFRLAGRTPTSRRSHCKDCSREYGRNRYRKNSLQYGVAVQNELTQMCHGCHITKTASDFAVDRGEVGGLKKTCKECYTHRSSKRRLKIKHKNLTSGIVSSHKTCRLCYTTKPHTEFHFSSSEISGLRSICKACSRLDAIARRQEKNRSVSKYRRTQAHKHDARKLVAALIRNRNLLREPCVVCGEIKSQAHHEDYSKPLDITWLCQRHHAERHMEIKRMKSLGIYTGSL